MIIAQNTYVRYLTLYTIWNCSNFTLTFKKLAAAEMYANVVTTHHTSWLHHRIYYGEAKQPRGSFSTFASLRSSPF
jgi:hypothetical protein